MSKFDHEKVNKNNKTKKYGSLKSYNSERNPIVKRPKNHYNKLNTYTSVVNRNVMTFGKYKNTNLINIPTYYLKWVILNFDERKANNKHVIDMFIRELRKREPELFI